MSAQQTSEAGITLMPVRNTVAEEIEQSAREQHTDISDLLTAALKALRFAKFEQQIAILRAEAPPTNYSPDHVPRLVKEVRAEMDLENRR